MSADDILDRARQALEGVTEGPWRWDGDSFSDVEPHTCPHGTQWCDHGPDLERVTPEGTEWDHTNAVITSNGYDASSLEIRKADAEFIAASRTLVPELVAELSRLRARETQLRALHKPVEIGATLCPVDCEHEDDRDCPQGRITVCGHCYDRAQEIAGGYYGEEGIEDCVLHPCPTVAVLDAEDQQ